MNNKSIFDGFELYSKYETCAFFKNKGPFKNHEIKDVIISIGTSNFNGEDFSNPLELGYNLSEYKNLGIYLSNSKKRLLQISKINLNIFKDIKEYIIDPIYCNWHIVPIELIQSFLKEILIDSTLEEYGCYCEVCGEYDKYAIPKNGKGLCYKHMKF